MQTTHAAPVAAPEPFSLLTKWETHLKVDGRAPRTLEGLLIARAEYAHRERMAEIKSIAAKLALLAPFLPELHRRGLRIAERDIASLDRGKTVRIRAPMLQTDEALYAALVDLGFREIERSTWGFRDDLVTLKHGRSLLVQIDVKKKVAEPVAAESQHGATTSP